EPRLQRIVDLRPTLADGRREREGREPRIDHPGMEIPVRDAGIGASQPRALVEKLPVVGIEGEEGEELRPEGALRRRLALGRMPPEPARDGTVQLAGGLLDLGAILRPHEMVARLLEESDRRRRE